MIDINDDLTTTALSIKLMYKDPNGNNKEHRNNQKTNTKEK